MTVSSAIDAPRESPTPWQKFVVAFVIFLVLMALAYGAASLGERGTIVTFPGAKHTLAFYQGIYSIWVTTILVTIALCCHVFSRSDKPNSWWRLFWTFAYLALLVHLYWMTAHVCGWNWDDIIHGAAGDRANSECIVEHPYLDCALALVWGLDVLAAWLFPFVPGVNVTRATPDDNRVLRNLRGIVHVFAFSVFFGATVMAPKATMEARALGLTMAALVVGATIFRIVRYEVDTKTLVWFIYVSFFRALNKFWPWYKLPTLLAMHNLVAVRAVLREKNLHNTSDIPVTNESGLRETVEFHPKFLCKREEDGWYNDRSKPAMGSASYTPNDPENAPEFTLSHPNARFGRNIPLSEVDPTRDGPILEPNPRVVSTELLARRDFIPAKSLNLLAAAWIQFQVHDWFNHGAPRRMEDDPFKIPLAKDDDWPGAETDAEGNKWMKIRRTRADPTRKPNDGACPETFVNSETHWWDSSQIYGSSAVSSGLYRSFVDGKLIVDEKTGLLRRNNGQEATAVSSNWWIGLSLMHNIFTKEHNAICDYLRGAYPVWRDKDLYRVARLVNNALMAKIHTVEWTCAILRHDVLDVTMNATWWGLAQEVVTKHLGRISEGEMISGIPGSKPQHFDADFCLTEEFAAVYRLHPLLPDEIPLHFQDESHRNVPARPPRTLKFESAQPNDPDLIIGPDAMTNATRGGVTLGDLVYTFGIENPGAVELRNFPKWMMRMQRRNGRAIEEYIDLATIDILRDRERAIPRYNRFRELFHMPRIRSFKEMTGGDLELAKALEDVYGHVDKVDLMVGMYAEKAPEGFGFSDTAFRVFILMASRRLKSDRFFTVDYRPEVYTQQGLNWVNNNTMKSVLLRHCPELAAALHDTDNAFKPWVITRGVAATPDAADESA